MNAELAPTLITRPFDHPDARKLSDLVQEEYRALYEGDGDVTPLDSGMFDPPRGLFLVMYDAAGRAIGSGGWRALDSGDEPGYADGDAEIKRMFVVREARGRGLSRTILARLEETARAAGRARMVLETGFKQRQAIELYRSSGYSLLPTTEKFGVYRCSSTSECYAKPL